MNIKKFQEIIEATDLVDSTGKYVVRKIPSGNYVIIDSIGDFIILEREKADDVCTIVWENLAPPESLN